MVAETSRILVVAAVGCLLGAGCRPAGGSELRRVTDEEEEPGIEIPRANPDDLPDPPMGTPYAVLAAEPPHGPFSGQTRVLLRGNGFGSDVRIWFGEQEIARENVLRVDAQRVQVTSPPGHAGAVDVVAQNGGDRSTSSSLTGGFTYDAFYADPSTGPTSGGTEITLHGDETDWDEETLVFVDREPCEILQVASASELECRTPPGTQGAKPVRVTTADDVSVDVLDAFTYSNAETGFRGGLSGNELDGQIKVLVFDNLTGAAVTNAAVVIGADDPIVERTNDSGLAVIDGDFEELPTVTVAAHCLLPITFVNVPVDTVVAFLDPLLSPACADPSGDLPAGGGSPGRGSGVAGELVWPEDQEFRSSGWTNVPPPQSPEEKLAAYVFNLSQSPSDSFRLPSGVLAVTPSSSGDAGYAFYLTVSPGNYTLYALAGIENRSKSPQSFTAYALGLLRGVAVPAGTTVTDVFLNVDVPLDHALTLEIDGPEPTSRGPDRVEANVAVRVGSEGYVLLPNGRADLLLNGGEASVDLVGVPPLIGSLAGTSYAASASAVTGEAGGMPLSVVGAVSGGNSNAVLRPGPFLEIPVLEQPSPNGDWNGRDLRWSAAAGGPDPDLVLIEIQEPSGLSSWQVVAPGDTREIRLPDLGAVGEDVAWPHGLQTFIIATAQLDDFVYGSLRYRDLTERNWFAHAMDASFAAY